MHKINTKKQIEFVALIATHGGQLMLCCEFRGETEAHQVIFKPNEKDEAAAQFFTLLAEKNQQEQDRLNALANRSNEENIA